ncbi:hypothetical protein PQR34_42815 [Paraburkholderia sediminicola]|uniref:hypothetical protein n=1 Tax=Paraburkholderia sediminicola TaxID=458836 RepID=UPI0038BD5733
MFLSREERTLLQMAAEDGIAKIDATIARLRGGNPAAFHDGKSLGGRVFLTKPASGIPYLSFRRSPPEIGR